MRTNRDILNILKRGDLLFFTSNNFIAKAIQWVTSSKINHVALYVDDGLVLESQNDTGVAVRDLEYYFNRKDERIQIGRVINIKEKTLEKVLAYACEKKGQRYDFFGLFGIFLKYMVKKIHLNKIITFYGENKINARRSYWCSEFLADAFLTQGIKFTEHDISYLTPSEMFNSPIIEKIEEKHADI